MIGALALRALPYLLGALAALAVAAAVYQQGHSAGSDQEKTICQVRDARREQAHDEAIARRTLDNALAKARQDELNLKGAIAHDDADRAVQLERDRLRADLRRTGGLRIAAPAACRGPAREAEAPADGQPGEAAAATIALPEQVESDLLDLAADADKVTEQARACVARLIEDAEE